MILETHWLTRWWRLLLGILFGTFSLICYSFFLIILIFFAPGPEFGSMYLVQNTQAGQSCPFGPRTMPGGQSRPWGQSRLQSFILLFLTMRVHPERTPHAHDAREVILCFRSRPLLELVGRQPLVGQLQRDPESSLAKYCQINS